MKLLHPTRPPPIPTLRNRWTGPDVESMAKILEVSNWALYLQKWSCSSLWNPFFPATLPVNLHLYEPLVPVIVSISGKMVRLILSGQGHHSLMHLPTFSSTGQVTLAAINGTLILVPYLWIQSLQPIRRWGICRLHLHGPNLQIGCRDLTIWQGTRIMAQTMASYI